MRPIIVLIWLCFSSTAHALNPEPNALFVRIIDVGAGHAAVIALPDNHYIVYDTGHWNTDTSVLNKIREIVPDNENIDLLVLSHSDSDHQGATDELLNHYKIDRVIRGGLERTTATWRDSNAAITSSNTDDVNLKSSDLQPGATYRYGDTWVTMVSGKYWPPNNWNLSNLSEKRNSGSVVIRIVFAGRSILFTGDSVGRHIDGSEDQLIGNERVMVENAHITTIDSDVLIAPHHGADNGSSNAFINAVSPEWVIFPAGHRYRHPRAAVAQRYINAGVLKEKMLRTDLGDDEGSDEWSHGRVSGHRDKSGDDDIDILIRSTGEVAVEYRNN